jgi:AcrR family transcriptional regulator
MQSSRTKFTSRKEPEGRNFPRDIETLTPKGQRTRKALLDAARVVFERDGFLDARISDITEECKMASGTFYTYFLSKEQIFYELAVGLLQEMLTGDSDMSVKTQGDPFSGIERANRRYLASYHKNAALMGLIEQVATFDEDLRLLRHARTRAFTERAKRQVASLQQLGHVSSDLDPYYCAVALTSMVSRYAYVCFVLPSEVDRDLDFEESVKTLSVLWANSLGISHNYASLPSFVQ